jgi:hypothetical protein
MGGWYMLINKPQTPEGRAGGKKNVSQKWGGDVVTSGSYRGEYFPTIRVALVLPKPKELDRAIFTSALLASLGT